MKKSNGSNGSNGSVPRRSNLSTQVLGAAAREERPLSDLQYWRAGRGERPAGGRDAELRALNEGRPWPTADDSAELVPIPDASGCVRIRPDASGCVGILNSRK